MNPTAKIYHDGRGIRFDITTNAGTFRSLRLDGYEVVNAGGKRVGISVESAQAIKAASAGVIAQTEQVLTGSQLSKLPEDQRRGFEFAGVKNDVVDIYTRVIPGRDITITL